MILIVSPADDLHTRCVAQDLAAMGARFRIVDALQLVHEGRLRFGAGAPPARRSHWTDVDGLDVDLDEVDVVWHRRRFLPVPTGLPDRDHEDFVRREWSDATAGVLASLDAWFVNDPAREAAAVKPLQLRLAERVGLRVPDTLITNDAAAAMEFVERHHGAVIHKTLTPARVTFRPTTRWSPSDRDALAALALAPVIFQEAVLGGRELRVVVIGERVFAAEFEAAPGLIDGRMDLETPYRPHALPDSLAAALRALTARLGLVYAAIDLKLTEQGEYVFLELNSHGQYLYVEVLTGLPLTAAMAELLAAGRSRATRSGSRAAIPPHANDACH